MSVYNVWDCVHTQYKKTRLFSYVIITKITFVSLRFLRQLSSKWHNDLETSHIWILVKDICNGVVLELRQTWISPRYKGGIFSSNNTEITCFMDCRTYDIPKAWSQPHNCMMCHRKTQAMTATRQVQQWHAYQEIQLCEVHVARCQVRCVLPVTSLFDLLSNVFSI